MKKINIRLFIVIYPMLFCPSITLAGVNTVTEEIKTSWGYSSNNTKTFVTDSYDIKTNNTWNFQYVYIAAATKIYEHGAKFCRIALQHNYSTWKIFTAPESCRTLCMDGYYGDTCDKTTPTDTCMHDDLTKVFFTNTSPAPYNEQDIDGFYYSDTDTIILSFLSTTSDEHGIIVSPYEFYGNNDPKTNIASVNTRDNSIKLCAPGYEKSNGECKRSLRCKCPANQGFKSKTDTTCIACDENLIDTDGVCQSNPEQCNKGYFSASGNEPCQKCPAGTYADEQGLTQCKECPENTYFSGTGATGRNKCQSCPNGKHSPSGSTSINSCVSDPTPPVNTCNCPTNQACKSATDNTCVPCGETPQSGITAQGICKKCNIGYIFDGTKCTQARIITPEQMKKCMGKIDPDEFKRCALGDY